MNMAKEGISKLEVRITNYSIWTTERKHTHTTNTLNACMCTMFISSECEKKKRKRMGLKTYWRNNGYKVPKFGQRHAPRDSKSWAHLKLKKRKEIHTKKHWN